MADYDLFALTGLAFDPPEKVPKKVKDAIEKKLKELGASLSTENQQLKRNEYNAQIGFLKACLGEGDASQGVFDGTRLNAHFTELAGIRTQREMSILRRTVNLKKQSGTHVITKGTIRAQVRTTKLSEANVEKIYQEAGFTISTVDPNKAFPKFPTYADEIFDELKQLRDMKDQNPQGHELAMCVDLYAFIAYLSSTPGIPADNPDEYKAKPTSDLKKILDDFSRPLSQRNDELGKLLASIASKGKSYVFNSDDNRAAYEKHLLYCSPQMERLLESIRIATNKYEANWAELCIKLIAEIFPGYDIALAIYNKEAGIKDDPYIPEEAIFYVRCSRCLNLSKFADLREAHKANKCCNCGSALYKSCNKCKKLVLASLDKCPECRFVFASTAMFAKFFVAAERALRRSHFEQAYDDLFQAQSADPSEKTRTAEMAARIAAEEMKYEKSVNDLLRLVADKSLQRASEVLADTIIKFPKLEFSSLSEHINSGLNKARTSFANLKNLAASKRADMCMEILDECADFDPAIDFLLETPPAACKSFSVGLDNARGYANLSWARSSERGVTYRVVVKQGKDIPANEEDGYVILDNATDTSYRDKGIQPGRNYSYALFSVRGGVFSSAVGKRIVFLADVTDAHCEQLVDSTIRLTWNNPKNSTGVSIQRTAEGTTTTLTENANGSYDDKGIKYGVTYTYRLCANYNGFPPSRGLELVITTMAYSPCSIDKSASKFAEKPIVGLADPAYNIELHLKIADPIPSNAVGFYYAVRTKTVADCGAPWADKQEIGLAPDLKKVTLAAYRSDGEIVYRGTAREENAYYVSLFTIYSFGGTDIVSDAWKWRFDRPLTANLVWRVKKRLFSKFYRLDIEISANRPFDRIPALVLCACGDAQHLRSLSDSKGRRILEVPERKAATLSHTFKDFFLIFEDTSLEGLNLFLFEASAIPGEKFVIRRDNWISESLRQQHQRQAR